MRKPYSTLGSRPNTINHSFLPVLYTYLDAPSEWLPYPYH